MTLSAHSQYLATHCSKLIYRPIIEVKEQVHFYHYYENTVFYRKFNCWRKGKEIITTHERYQIKYRN